MTENMDLSFDDLIKNYISPNLKKNNFKKKNLNFIKHINDVSFIVNIQKTQGSSWFENVFYVNYGFFLSKIRTDNSELKAIWDCDYSLRIITVPEFESSFKHSFGIVESTNIERLGNYINHEINFVILPFLNPIDNVQQGINFLIENGTRNDKVLIEYLLINKRYSELAKFLNRIFKLRSEKTDDGSIQANKRYEFYISNLIQSFGLSLKDILNFK